VAVAPQADRFSMRDLDGDRRLEVVTGSPYVGFGTGDDDVPRVWRWNGRQYQEASSEFPAFYRQLAARYAAYIRRMEVQREEFRRSAWQRALQKATSLAG
jgi:phytoene dehydrogenase-like protein